MKKSLRLVVHGKRPNSQGAQPISIPTSACHSLSPDHPVSMLWSGANSWTDEDYMALPRGSDLSLEARESLSRGNSLVDQENNNLDTDVMFEMDP